MNKLYAVFIVLLFSVFVVGCGSLVKPEPKTTEQVKKSVVRIRAENQMSDEKREGTGFVVGVSNDKAYIITVSHVVEGDPNPTVEFFENNEIKAEVLDNESQENGLALLSVEGQIPYDVMPLYLAKKRDLKLEDKLFTVGFPRGGARWSYNKLSYSGQKKRNLLFSGNINEGNSGSPVIKEDKAVAVINSVADHAFSTSAVSIREFLEGATGGNKILNEMKKWDIATWRKEYEARLELGKTKRTSRTGHANTFSPHYVALVIGNADYSINPLPNPINDAKNIGKGLKELGFKVIYVVNASRQTMEATIHTFMQTLSENTIGLFYYSGHGIQYEEKNYLIPIDAGTFYQPRNIKKLVNVEYVIAEMEKAKTRMNIVILDASYSNSFGDKYVKKGLGKIKNIPLNSLIAYSASPETVISGKQNGNSLYAKYLLEALQKAKKHNKSVFSLHTLQKMKDNRIIEDVFLSIHRKVEKASGGIQQPLFESSLQKPFCFGGCSDNSFLALDPGSEYSCESIPLASDCVLISSPSDEATGTCEGAYYTNSSGEECCRDQRGVERCWDD
ncbi:caspase family protein [Candidatus Parabeggiatoa sp. HSG14]|uniref:caspase family protein n=1 Tax=Candidatus Parabeggiatoa sp. HSG14 TaxID=3055593 RepID=UPI0025A8EED5|nr:caspase family protein [Thiotrichales bacterium HSG14]